MKFSSAVFTIVTSLVLSYTPGHMENRDHSVELCPSYV